MKLIDLFDRGAARGLDRVFLRNASSQTSYGDAQKASYRIARALLHSGLTPGSVVGTFTPNTMLLMPIVLGILRAGMTWLPINHRYEVSEASHAISSHDCRLVFHHSALGDILANTLVPTPFMMICIDSRAGDMPSLEEWAKPYSDVPFLEVAPTTDVAVIRSTGGTTGLSKGVMLTDSNYTAIFSALFSSVDIGPDPVHLAVAPMSHAAGTLSLAMAPLGGQNVIMEEFDASEVLRNIERFGVTQMFVAPTMLYMLLDCRSLLDHDYSSLRQIIYSGAPMSVEKLRRAMDVFGPVMMQAYGQAECPFFCTILSPQDHVNAVASGNDGILWSCGAPTPFVWVEIMGDGGRLLAPGERGEVVVRGDLVMKGYYRNPEATAKASIFDWHHTGDIGYKDEAGLVYIVDRDRDLIISGGFNIFPSEIEQVIWSHPSVKDCAVIGAPDDKWGEAVVAVVELRANGTGHPETEGQEILRMCRDKLGGMKTPKRIEFWESLPRSSVGKVLKREIRKQFWKDQARAV